MPARRWVGGKVASHEELDRVDAKFWEDAGPAARFEASIELAFQTWSLKHPDAPSPDLVAMLSAFEKFGVHYLVIGGHAVGLHARPRSTKDLDLWLDRARPNIDKACAALAEFGVPDRIIDDLRAATADEIVWMGRAPARVDFLQTIPGATFEVAWRRRVDVVSGKLLVRVIGRDDLLNNKRAVGRPQDLRDVRAIERTAQAPPKRARKRR